MINISTFSGYVPSSTQTCKPSGKKEATAPLTDDNICRLGDYCPDTTGSFYLESKAPADNTIIYEGVAYRAGTVMFANGRISEGTLAEDTNFEGDLLKAGTRVKFDNTGKLAGLIERLGWTDNIAICAGVAYRAEKLRFNHGIVSEGMLAADTKLEGEI